MIRIEHLNSKQLDTFINSDSFNALDFIPISRHRAASHLANPRIDDTDNLLYLAYEESELVGYLGVLADKIWYKGSLEKCGWLSCLWINNKHRGKRIAQQLVDTAIEDWKKRILVTEFTAPAKGLYDKTGIFYDLTNNKGTRLYLRSDLTTILPPKKEVFKTMKPLFNAADTLFNAVFDFRFAFKKQRSEELTITQVSTIDIQIEAFITSKQDDNLFKRKADELNWIIKNPWVLSSNETTESKKYHFSSVDKSFEFLPLKLTNDKGTIVAFLLFTKRNNSLKLPYCYYNNIKDVAQVLNQLLINWKVSTFTCFHTPLVEHLATRSTPALYSKPIYRKYIVSSVFEKDELPTNFSIQDGDADCSFT